MDSLTTLSLFKNKTILMVDDDDIIRGLPDDILSEYGTQVFTAANGLEGVSSFQENRESIDLVLMDVMMPWMDGIKAFQEIRKTNPEIPVIFISGYSEVKELQPILAERYKVGFLAKPFTQRSLIDLMKQFLLAYNN